MRRLRAWVLLGFFLTSACWPLHRAPAQPNEAEQQQKAAEFVGLYDRWRQSHDPEETVTLGERMLVLEGALKDWPLQVVRERLKGELWFGLGDAYMHWRRGELADAFEKAIAAYLAALSVRTREGLPREWAETQNNLGLAYASRIHGDPADNLEKAIAAYQAALSVRTREAFPADWAATLYSLGNAYRQRIRGSTADNLEKAIASLEGALQVRTREALPREWAETQNELGLAYAERILGEPADNMEEAIAHHEAALTVRTPNTLAHEWAETQNDLGRAYADRIRDERADNLEKAIAAYLAALTVRSRETRPREWAETQNNIALAYAERIRGNRADNLEQAIAAFGAVLEVKTPLSSPRDWADVQNELGTAYLRRVLGDPPENIEKAIAAYQAALTIRTPEGLPRDWADSQSSLGFAFSQRVRGVRAENLEKAIAAYQAALTVRTREAFPRDHLQTARLLGEALLEAREWRKAAIAYAGARDAFLLLFGQGLNDDEARELIWQAGPLFAEAAFTATQLGEMETALALASEGRARLMSVALNLQALKLPGSKRQRLDELRTAIRAEQRTMESAHGMDRSTAVEKLIDLRRELIGLVKEGTASETTLGSALMQARAGVAKGGAVVVPILTKLGGKILIVNVDPSGSDTQAPPKNVGAKKAASDRVGPRSPIAVLDLPELTTDRLDLLLRGDGKDDKSGGWLGAYPASNLPEPELYKRARAWPEALRKFVPSLWPLFAGRLDAALKELRLKPGARLIWLPTGALGILPLGAAHNPANDRRLADDYEIVYAPSLEALATVQMQIAKTAPATLAVIVNPTGDLPGTDSEGKLVASHFSSRERTVLERAAATPDAALAALKGRTYWHFASHGTFSWDDARQSALVMHNKARLSVGRLLDADGLGHPRLVVLSACETGLYDINRNPDEFIGLPGTFTVLGASGVLGTLWHVSDAATALLIARFYELHIGQRLPPPTALSRAQAWLRQATNGELSTYAKIAGRQGRLESRHVAEIEQQLSAEGLARSRNSAIVEWVSPNPARSTAKTAADNSGSVARPYAHPYFWAGFIYMGL